MRGKCRYKCTSLLRNIDHQAIHDNLWKLSDKIKSMFYSKFVVRELLSENEHFRLIGRGFSVTITILKREIQ